MGKLRQVTNNIEPRLKKLQGKFGTIPPQAGRFFQGRTPIRSGNARRNTNTVGQEIRADYDYANRLNQGYSKQAPNGMTQPTINFIRNLVRAIVRG